jgi:hypothetical protein
MNPRMLLSRSAVPVLVNVNLRTVALYEQSSRYARYPLAVPWAFQSPTKKSVAAALSCLASISQHYEPPTRDELDLHDEHDLISHD